MELFLTYIEAFFVNVNSFGYLSWILSFNFMMGYWIYYYSTGYPDVIGFTGYISKLSIFEFLKNKTHREYLKSTYFENPSNLKIFYINIFLFSMLISLVGSFVYVIILYKWYSIIFILVTMWITNLYGRRLENYYHIGLSEKYREQLTTSWKHANLDLPQEKRKKRREEGIQLGNKRILKKVTMLGCLSLICNLYASYQILFNYYKI